MAEAAKVVNSIDLDLHVIGAVTGDLPDLAQQWVRFSDSSRFVWHEEWSDLMARLGRLHAAYRGSAMSARQQAQYRELVHKLEDALPTIERLGFTQPPVSPGDLRRHANGVAGSGRSPRPRASRQ